MLPRLTLSLLLALILAPSMGCGRASPEAEMDARARAQALNDSAVSLFQQREFGHARPSDAALLALLDSALVLDSTHAIARSNKISFLMDFRKYERALAASHDYVRRDSQNTEARAFHAMLLDWTGRRADALPHYRRALRDYDTAIRAHPDSLGLYVNRAFARAAMGDEARARSTLDSLLAARPGDSAQVTLMRDILADTSRRGLLRQRVAP